MSVYLCIIESTGVFVSYGQNSLQHAVQEWTVCTILIKHHVSRVVKLTLFSKQLHFSSQCWHEYIIFIQICQRLFFFFFLLDSGTSGESGVQCDEVTFSGAFPFTTVIKNGYLSYYLDIPLQTSLLKRRSILQDNMMSCDSLWYLSPREGYLDSHNKKDNK